MTKKQRKKEITKQNRRIYNHPRYEIEERKKKRKNKERKKKKEITK